MADRAHEITDKIILDTEKRLRKEYEQAAAELEKKWRDYLRRFEAKDKKWRQWVEEGKKTKEDYQKWRRGQIMMGDRWKAMKETIADDLRNTAKIARQIVLDQRADIYAINHAYGTYQVESSGGVNTSYTLYNHEAVEKILRDNPGLLPPPGRAVSRAIAEGKAKRWARQKIQGTMLHGILQGESIPKLARRLATEVADSDFKAAVRNARTMATNAQNGGRYDAYRRARDMGIDLTIQWAATLDNRTRHSHRQMHGQRREVDEPFEIREGSRTYHIMWPADCDSMQSDAPQQSIWNCFIGETNVASDSEIVRSYKHEYSGEFVTVKTAGGVNFTCTPNHPILTSLGWVPAAQLNEGDDLLIASVSDSVVLTDGNIDHVHPSFEALHCALAQLGDVCKSPMANFNFHGDIPTSDVEVVSKERLLRKDVNSGTRKGINKPIFKDTDPFVAGKCHFVSCFRGIYISALSFMRRCRKALTFFWRSLRHADIHRFRSVPWCDTGIAKNTVNDLPAVHDVVGNLIDGFTGVISTDNIVSIHRDTRRHVHVYNLQTENGYYFVNNIIDRNSQKCNGKFAIAHNCRCTLLAFVKGYEHEMQTDSDKMTMSFEEWLEVEPGHEQFQPILSQYDKGQKIRYAWIRKYRDE